MHTYARLLDGLGYSQAIQQTNSHESPPSQPQKPPRSRVRTSLHNNEDLPSGKLT